MTEKLSCWEVQDCGREPGGANASEHGECPASMDTTSDGLNGGVNAGRICWAVSGTLCGDKVQGTFAEKQLSCIACEFHSQVEEEQREEFHLLRPGQVYQPRKR